MKRTLLFLVSLVLAAMLLAVLPLHGEEAIYDDVVRLHVLAASDTAADQGEKIVVRDAVLAAYGELLTSCQSVGEAQMLLGERLGDVARVANEALQASGSRHTALVTLQKERFERRVYGKQVLPAGTYLSLVITIGEGEGQNWWCVLYPPLCTDAAMGETLSGDCFTEAENELISGKYVIRLRVLEWAEALFGE